MRKRQAQTPQPGAARLRELLTLPRGLLRADEASSSPTHWPDEPRARCLGASGAGQRDARPGGLVS